jgi:hypothetical protein
VTPVAGRTAAGALLAIVACAALAVHVATWIPAVRVLVPSIGLPLVQSVVLLALAAAMIRASSIPTRRERAARAAVVLAIAFVLMCLLSLPFEHVGQNFMGDGQDFAGHRSKFEENIPLAGGRPALHLKAHLGDALLAVFDRSFGPSPESSGRAYQAVSRVGGLLFVMELAIVLVVLRASRRACRFASLALAAPVAIGFFGYYELGYLAVSGAAFPLLMIGLRTRRTRLEGSAAALQGLHAALHGFGLLGVAGGLLATAAAARSWWHGLSAIVRFGAAAAASYLGWIVLYRLVCDVSVVSDPASSNVAMRGLTTAFYFDRRLVHPLTSFNALAEIGVTSLAVGVPVLLFAAVRARRTAVVAPALAYSCPGLLFLIAWWPSLGVSHDMDLLLGGFAGMMAAAWMCSRERRQAVAALAVLAFVHVAFWAGVADRSLARIWLGE